MFLDFESRQAGNYFITTLLGLLLETTACSRRATPASTLCTFGALIVELVFEAPVFLCGGTLLVL